MIQFYVWAGAITAILICFYLLICISLKRRPGVKAILFIITIVLGFTLYLYGYLNLYMASGLIEYTKSILRAVLSTIRMFLIDNDYSEISEGANAENWMLTPYYLIPYWSCHLLAPITTVLAAISLFGKKLRLIVRALLSFWKERYIIIGVNPKSLCFAGNIMTGDDGKLHKKRLVIFIDENADSVAKDRIYNMGGIIFDNPMFSGEILSKKSLFYVGFNRLKLYRKIYIFAFCDSAIVNSIIANDILKYADQYKYPNNYLKGIYVHTSSDVIIDDLESKINKFNIRKYNISYFCEEDLAARELFIDYPPYRCLEFDKDSGLAKQKDGIDKPSITIIILGFGVNGNHVLRKAIMNAQFEGCTCNAVVFDNKMDTLKGKFISKYPGLFMENGPNQIEIEFRNDDVGSLSFYNKIREYILLNRNNTLCRIDYVISCLGDDYINLEVMTDIRNYLWNQNVDKLPIMAAQISDSKYQLFINQDASDESRILFGDYNNIFTYDIIIAEKMDRLAMMVDKIAYGGKSWTGLSNHEKNSNRAVASYLGAYLYIMGYSLINGKQKKQMDENKSEYMLADTASLTNLFEGLKKQVEELHCEPLLESLAATEHLRWNAFHYANGWSVKPLDEINDTSSRKAPYKKRHGCLVSWKKLRDLGQKLCNDRNVYQKYDKDIVAKAYDIINSFNKMKDISDEDRLYIIRR